MPARSRQNADARNGRYKVVHGDAVGDLPDASYGRWTRSCAKCSFVGRPLDEGW
jgi:hypothetical protein